MGTLLARILAWWQGMEKTQRTVTLVGGGIVAAAMIGMIVYGSRPKMEPLYSGLSAADQGMIKDSLDGMGIKAEYGEQGQVLVPSNKVTEARAKLAMANKLPTHGSSADLDLAKFSLMDSQPVEQERLLNLKEKELAETIERFRGVASAKVNLAPEEKSAFQRDEKPARVSISITEDAAGGLGPAEAAAIARLTKNAINGLEMSNISIISDTRGILLFDGSQENGSGAADRKRAAEISDGQLRASRIQSQLDKILGIGNSSVSVEVELDYDEKSVVNEVLKPTENPLSSTVSTETFNGASARSGGARGTDGNTETSQPGSGTKGNGGDTYNTKQNSSDYGHEQTNETIKKAPGTLVGMSINVVLNKSKVKEDAEAAVKEIINGEIGHRTGDPRFVSNVTSIEFDETSAKKADASNKEVAKKAQLQQLISLLPVAALVIVGLLVMKTLTKALKPTAVLSAALPGGGTVSLPGGGSAAEAGAASAIEAGSGFRPGLEAGAYTDEHGNQAYGHGPDGADVQFNEDGTPIIPGAVRINYGALKTEDVDPIPEQVNVPLEQIKAMAVTRPEGVANLLKTWMLEERR